MSQLELVTLALECLHKRETTQYLRGDHSYALMGLLRIRPKIDPSDSAFQAFARLVVNFIVELCLSGLSNTLLSSYNRHMNA